jgi:glucose/arabinose dehydrogenase
MTSACFRTFWRTLLVAVVATLGARPALAQLRADLVVSGLDRPLAFVQDPTLPNVQLVVEQGGRVRVVQGGVLLATDFLDLTGQVAGGGEQGLLGLAFAPNYASSGRVFVNFTDLAGNTVVTRFVRDVSNPLRVDPASRFDLVWPGGAAFIAQPFANHNGGHLLFGPDGFLYIGLGDGGAANDPFHLAQNPASLLGKMLRIDVAVSGSHPTGYTVPTDNPFFGAAGVLSEIWAFGLRNPWRYFFDDPARGGSGALLIGDVGQGAWEEINYEPAGRSGRNYGWRNREGANPNVEDLPPFSLPLTDPIHQYSHAEGRSVTGGFVYRGTALGAAYAGRYFFADFSFGRIWSLRLDVNAQTGEATAADLTEHTTELGAGAGFLPSSFGLDSSGELYVVNFSGSVHRLSLALAGGCATPDPFVALGGGTCVNGGWLPPGIAPPSGGTSPPPPPPPPPATGCATPDPFAALGGGTCVNGGWLPPGIAPPSGGTSPPPSPPPAPTGCATPDPFVALGGGTCVNGGWLPPGIAPLIAIQTIRGS